MKIQTSTLEIAFWLSCFGWAITGWDRWLYLVCGAFVGITTAIFINDK